jgi:hypothetical protein
MPKPKSKFQAHKNHGKMLSRSRGLLVVHSLLAKLPPPPLTKKQVETLNAQRYPNEPEFENVPDPNATLGVK